MKNRKIKNKEPLYIHLHMPRTGGTTIGTHIRNNHKKEEVLSLDFYRNRSLRSNKIAHNFLMKLNKEEKSKIKYIIGHGVFYGVHKFFKDRDVRYITFLRNPLDRTISTYNHMINRLNKINNKEYVDKCPKEFRKFILAEIKYFKKAVVKNGNYISFKEFLNTSYWAENFQIRLILECFEDKFIKKIKISDLNKAKNFLNKFYFVGITENQDDFDFLFYLLGINKFFENQNISKPTFSIKEDPEIKENLIFKNKFDLEFYSYGKKLNKEFKRKFNNFSFILFLMRNRRNSNIILRFLYKGSAKLKKYSKTYKKSIKLIKELI